MSRAHGKIAARVAACSLVPALLAFVVFGCGQGERPNPANDAANDERGEGTPEGTPLVTPTAEADAQSPQPIAAPGDETNTGVAQTKALPVTEIAYKNRAGDKSGTKGVTFDDIKFDQKKGERFRQAMITDEIKALYDSNIKIRGYILPTFKQSGLSRFVLVRDNMECCFGPGAALYDCVVVEMVEGNTAEFTVRPVTVEGRFSFQRLEDPISGELRAIYRLDGVHVE